MKFTRHTGRETQRKRNEQPVRGNHSLRTAKGCPKTAYKVKMGKETEAKKEGMVVFIKREKPISVKEVRH
ncbi:putative bax inhibitor 1-like isoform X2 [Sesbania bispinosa]|nr:putative bax inhibitor 1-like isoform X2 [Sesbania bispinosa]